ncbi:MAG: rhomboid family intramembrane serine protease [Nitrosopumilaceae archaeon]
MFIPYTTLTVITICVGLFFGLNPLFDYTWLMLAGQNTHWWTLITYQYLHANVRHIVSNLVILSVFGALIESRIGSIRTLLFINISGILSGLWWVLFHLNAPESYVVGISGSTYSLVSVCFLYILPRKNRYAYYGALVALIILALIQPIVSLTNNSAWGSHIMGIFVGMLYAAYLMRPVRL